MKAPTAAAPLVGLTVISGRSVDQLTGGMFSVPSEVSNVSR